MIQKKIKQLLLSIILILSVCLSACSNKKDTNSQSDAVTNNSTNSETNSNQSADILQQDSNLLTKSKEDLSLYQVGNMTVLRMTRSEELRVGKECRLEVRSGWLSEQ